jgi:hypothetical protein
VYGKALRQKRGYPAPGFAFSGMFRQKKKMTLRVLPAIRLPGSIVKVAPAGSGISSAAVAY